MWTHARTIVPRQLLGAETRFIRFGDESDDFALLFDGGIRRGPDTIKALALGADAVLLGRPYVCGLAIGGEHGVREVVRNFLADLDLTLAGQHSVPESDRSVLVETDLP